MPRATTTGGRGRAGPRQQNKLPISLLHHAIQLILSLCQDRLFDLPISLCCNFVKLILLYVHVRSFRLSQSSKLPDLASMCRRGIFSFKALNLSHKSHTSIVSSFRCRLIVIDCFASPLGSLYCINLSTDSYLQLHVHVHVHVHIAQTRVFKWMYTHSNEIPFYICVVGHSATFVALAYTHMSCTQ